MFLDERINKESGRIYRNFIFLFTSITFLVLLSRLIYYFNIHQFHFSYIIAESLLLLDGLLILSVGEISSLGKIKDEAFYYKRYRYYFKAMFIYLAIGLLGFAIALPFDYSKNFADLSSITFLIQLESFGFLFFVVSFKKARIHFNILLFQRAEGIILRK